MLRPFWPRLSRQSSKPRSAASCVQAELMMPVPPINRTFKHTSLIYERHDRHHLTNFARCAADLSRDSEEGFRAGDGLKFIQREFRSPLSLMTSAYHFADDFGRR